MFCDIMYQETKNKEAKGMNKIQLLKEPGYIYDLNFIFCLRFNTQLYIDALPSDNKKEENVKSFMEILNRFQDIPDDLYVFFHAIETGRAFLPTFYFNPYKDNFPTVYNFKYFLKEVSDRDKLVRNVIRFYFCDLDDDAVEQCASSLNEIFSHIKNSEYSDEEKNKLYEFFIDPSRYLQLLQYELMQKEIMLSDYYKDHFQKIIDLYNRTTFESLYLHLKDLRALVIDKDADILYVSYCLLNKFCVSVWFLEDGFLPLLGCEYMSILGYTKDTCMESELYGFGTALCEESRIKILNYLIEREEVTCKDLEKKFSFSGSTAYHHINIMTKAGLVKTRNEGKTVLYSLNKKYISNVISVLNKILVNKKGK